MLDIQIVVKMKSGAEVKLSPDQVQTVARWVEGLVFNGVSKVQTQTPASPKRGGGKRKFGSRPWTAEEDLELKNFAQTYPIGTPRRQKAMEQFGKERNRTRSAVEVRLYKMFPVNQRHATNTVNLPSMFGSVIS